LTNITEMSINAMAEEVDINGLLFEQHLGQPGRHKVYRVDRIDGAWYVAGLNVPVWTEDEEWVYSWSVVLLTPEGWVAEVARGVVSREVVRFGLLPRWIGYLTDSIADTDAQDVVRYGLAREREAYSMKRLKQPKLVGEKLKW
jgi:hypothetical protein